MEDVCITEADYEVGKVLKYFRPNPTGQDIYLGKDGVTLIKDEDKIRAAQRIFKHNYYKPGGKGAKKIFKRMVPCTANATLHQ
jgi:hypothetical protein